MDEFGNSQQDTSRNHVFRNDGNVAFATLVSRLQQGLEKTRLRDTTTSTEEEESVRAGERKKDGAEDEEGALFWGGGGGGAVATVEVETVENRWLQIRGGRRLSLTVVYLSAPPLWEEQLPRSLRELVRRGGGGGGGGSSSSSSSSSESGESGESGENGSSGDGSESSKPWAEFHNFPYYSTLGQLKLSAAQANLLAELTTWTVLQNAGEIRRALRAE